MLFQRRISQLRFSQGFTLIEILVVLVILSIFISLSTYVFSGIDQRYLTKEASRLKLLFDTAASNSMILNQNISWSYWSKTGIYQFSQIDKLTDTQKSTDPLFKQHSFKKPIILKIKSESHFTSKNQSKSSDEQKIVFLSSGEYTPFSMTLSNKGKTYITLVGDGINLIKLEFNQ